MKRPAPLRRRAPLRTKTRLRRSAPRPREHHAATKSAWDTTWPAARAAALERDGHMCGMCGQPAGEVNHRVPRQMGGRNNDDRRHALSRLVSVCHACHDRYERRDRAAGYADGFFVPAGYVAADYPILYRGVPSLLADDGTVMPVAGDAPAGLPALAAEVARLRAGRMG